MILSKLIINQVINLLVKNFKLDKIKDYVFKPNKNDEDIKEMKDDIKILKAIAHPSQEYICCRKCGCKIVKTKEK